jgi:hypothetical protein
MCFVAESLPGPPDVFLLNDRACLLLSNYASNPCHKSET